MLLAQRGAVPRCELVASLFAPTAGASAAELEASYLRTGLLTYCRPAEAAAAAAAAGAGAGAGGDGGPQDTLWVAPASARLRAAFGSLVSDGRWQSYRERALAELAKLELLQRAEQLAGRRAEQAAEGEALARLMASGAAGADAGASALLAEGARLLGEERARTAAELRRVREEYDALRWRGRWDAR